MRRNFVIMAAALVLLGFAVIQNFVLADKNDAGAIQIKTLLRPGHPAPSIVLQGLNGNSYSLGGVRDQPMVINFWASWCHPCQEEAPDLVKLNDRLKGKFDLYAVNTTKWDTLQDAKEFVKQHQFTFPVLLDPEDKASKLYDVRAIPTSFLIDQQGVVVDVIFGVIDVRDLEKKIKKLIK